MRPAIEPGRDETPTVDPAIVVAIAIALAASDDLDPSGDVAPPGTISAWRAAGRSVEAFDAYDAARFSRALRRTSALGGVR